MKIYGMYCKTLCSKLNKTMTTTTQVMESTVTQEKEHDLVRGEYSASDAQEIINHLISKKINFHEMRNFSHEIRFGEVDQSSIKRTKELIQARETMNEVIKEAQTTGKNLRIKSTISIEII